MGSPNGCTSQETIRKMEKGIGGLLKLSREQHFTVVLLANAHPNACVLALLFLNFLPCIILHVCFANQKFNQLLQGYPPLIAQPEDTYNGLYQDTGL
jgi:hypothetical protein